MMNRTDTQTQTGGPDGGAASFLPPGVVIAGRYVILGFLGRGGMSTVYEADDQLLDRRVALKILEGSADSAQAERFRREVVVGQEGHPNLVTTFDAGIWENRFFIAMEKIEGRSLRELITTEGRLSSDRLDRLVEELISGLDHLHRRGITHRDLKSGNILITTEGTAKIADFGLARIPEDHTVTLSHEGVGTPAYMAPEQILGRRIGPPADLYALGVVLFEALVGERPFSGSSHGAVLHQHLKTLPNANLLRSGSKRIRNLILRLLEKNPYRRFPDAGECLDAWRSKRIRRPVRRKRLALGIACIVLLGVFGTITIFSGTAVQTLIEGSEISGVNRWGAQAWTRSFPGAVESIEVPGTGSTPPGSLVAYHTDPSDPKSSHILLLDRQGETVFDFQPALDPFLLRNNGFSGSLVRYRLLPATDVDDDGEPDLLAILYGTPWYFSAVVRLAAETRPVTARAVLFNPGIIEWARRRDADGDGESEWYVAAMDNELLHTACVYRVDGTMVSWPPPRYGTQPAFPNLRWFSVIPRKGGRSFRKLAFSNEGGLNIVMQDGDKIDLDRWGNTSSEVIDGDDPAKTAAARLARWEHLSTVHLLLLDNDANSARRLLDEIEPGSLDTDPIADAFRLLLEGRAALFVGDYPAADRFAGQSFAVAPISDDALMLSVTARILGHRWDAVGELIDPDTAITMGSPADFQETRGILAWLEGRNEEAWRLFEGRSTLPPGLAARHRARMLIGRHRFDPTLAVLNKASGAACREGLDLLKAVALARLDRLDEADRALLVEGEHHPWLRPEIEIVTASIACRRGTGSAEDLRRAAEALREKAVRDLPAFLDLPLLLADAAAAALEIEAYDLATHLLDQAEAAHPGLLITKDLRSKLK